jgi:hypothetical protein
MHQPPERAHLNCQDSCRRRFTDPNTPHRRLEGRADLDIRCSVATGGARRAGLAALLHLVVLVTLATFAWRGAAQGVVCETITLKSGQVNGAPGLPGQPDDSVRRHPMRRIGTDPLSQNPFNAAGWFTPAQNGARASVIDPLDIWIDTLPLPCDPDARWINYSALSSPNASVLYAVPFNVQSDCIVSATLQLCWAVDDSLGDPAGGPNPAGVYVNGAPTAPIIAGGLYYNRSVETRNIAVHPGVNWLHLYVRDLNPCCTGLIFSAQIEVVCCVCAPPPRNMALWMPFDEPSGSTTSNVVLHPSGDGTLSAPGAQLGSPGMVANAVCFDDSRVDVPHYRAMLLDRDVTIDTWIKPLPQAPGHNWKYTIVDKRQFAPARQGYWLYLDDPTGSGTGTLTLELNDGTIRTTTGPTVLLGPWHYIAAIVRRDCGGVGNVCVEFCVDGIWTPLTPPTTPTFTNVTGSTSSVAPLRIADDRAPNFNNWLLGCLDELEIFGRALSRPEIESIYNARYLGKCKETCQLDSQRSTDGIGPATVVPLRLCNTTSAVQCYNLTFWPLVCPPSTTPGPTGITTNPPGPTFCVQPLSCSTVWLTIPRPPFVHAGDESCYAACFTNIATGDQHCCFGSVRWSPSIRVRGLDRMRMSPVMRLLSPVVLPIEVQNAGQGPVNLPYRVRVTGPDMGPDVSGISLNGAAPGTAVTGVLSLPVGGTRIIDCSAMFVVDDPQQWYSVLFEADLDGDGDYEPMEAVSVTSMLEDPCPLAMNDVFESYPTGTACGLSGWEEWVGSTDVCGQVVIDQARSGDRSLKIVGSIGGSTGLGDDTVHRLAASGGRWTFRAQTFVPSGATGTAAIVLLNTYDDPPGSPPSAYRWSLQVRLDADIGRVHADPDGENTALVRGRWAEFRAEIDFDHDSVDYYYDGVRFITGKSWVNGVSMGGQPRMQALDLYAGEPTVRGTTGTYFDDISIRRACSQPCPADVNGDGAVNIGDFLSFLQLFAAGDLRADFDGDGGVNVGDFLGFLSAYAGGCP